MGLGALGALRERIRALDAARLALADEVLGLVRPLYSVIPNGWTPGDLWALHEAVAQVRNHLYRESEVLGLLTTEIHDAIGRAEERGCGTVRFEPF